MSSLDEETAFLQLMSLYGLTEEHHNQQVSNIHLQELTCSGCERWKFLPPYLELENIVADDIDKSHEDPGTKRYKFLLKWKDMKGFQATYRQLINALLKTKCRQDGEKLCEMLKKDVIQHQLPTAIAGAPPHHAGQLPIAPTDASSHHGGQLPIATVDASSHHAGQLPIAPADASSHHAGQLPIATLDALPDHAPIAIADASSHHAQGADIPPDQPAHLLDLDPNSPIYKDLKRQLDKGLRNITAQYSIYVRRIRESLQDKGVTAKDLCANLLNFSAFNHETTEQKRMLISVHKAELDKAVDLYDVFNLISTVYASFLNYDVFQFIVDTYQLDNGQEELKYDEHLEAYLKKHKLSEFIEIKPRLREVTADSSELILKIDIESTSRLSKIKDLQSFIAEILEMKFATLQLLDISKGCVIVTFIIPAHIAEIVFNEQTVFTEEQVQMFQAESILWLKCNGFTFSFIIEAIDDNHQKDKQKGEVCDQPSCVLYKFIDEPDDELKCMICLEVAEDPLQHETCGKLVCKECIEKYGREKPCPNCRREGSAFFTDNRSRRHIEELSIKCTYGCGWEGTVGTFQKHISTCEFSYRVQNVTHGVSSIYAPVQEMSSGKKHFGHAIVLHLKYLPPGIAQDIISCYFENQGDDVEVLSFEEIGANEAIASVAGLTNEELKIVLQKRHKLGKHTFTVKIKESDIDPANDDNRTIEVKGIDGALSEDILKMYFENKKAGSRRGAVETCSIVGNGRALITFYDYEVAANVLSKNNHKIGGSPLEVKQFQYLMGEETDGVQYEQDKIKITSTIQQPHLLLCVETLLDMDEKDFTLKMITDESYILVFNSAYTIKELREMCGKMESSKQVTLTADLLKNSSRVLVRNIAAHFENADILKMYFESNKSGGSENGVEDICLVENGIAVVTFVDSKVSDCVLQRQHHKLGSNVIIERYSDGDVVADQGVLSQFELTSSDGLDPLIMKCLARDYICLSEELKQLNLKLEVKADSIIIKSTKPVGAEWPEASKKQVFDLVCSHFAVTSAGVPERAIPGLTELLLQFKEERLFDFKLYNKSTALNAAGSKEAIDQFNACMKKITEEHIQTQASYKLSPAEYVFTTQVILNELKVEFPRLVIAPKPDGILHVAGSVSNVKAFDERFAELNCYDSVEVHVSTSLIEFFRTSDGRSKLSNYIKKVVVGVFFPDNKHEKIQLQLLCKPSDLQLTQEIVAELRRKTAEIQVPLSESFQLVRSELADFQSTCNFLQAEKHIQIFPGQKFITISGFKGDLEYCEETLTDYVKRNSMMSKDITLQNGEWKLFETSMKGRWEDLLRKAKELNVDITPNPHSVPICISLVGKRVNVNAIVEHLTQLKSTVQKTVIPIDRPGICDLFTSERGRLYMDGIEFRANVAIFTIQGPEDGAGPNEEDMNLKAFDSQTKCTASINNIKLHICIGDITEFKADVIVNAANEELRHIGGVAGAIAKKGGPVIQEDSTRYVRRSGKVDTGCSWLTTTTGDLPCKALIHAVGPKWTGFMKEKEVALLSKTCKSALEKCRSGKYFSVVFPAISSGIYGFPIHLCADTMVEAAIDFSTKNLASSLQKITFIFHPTKAQQSLPFVDSLKRKIPAEKIYSIASPQITSPKQVNGKGTEKKHSPVTGKETERKVTDTVFNKVEVRQGGLLDVQADVIVNTSNPNLDLSQGAVARVLLKAGGQSLQQECDEVSPITVDDVAITGPGNLPCQYVLHTVMPSHKKRSSEAEKVLGRSVQKCLKKCDEKGAASIAFPAIGTGNLGYPNDVVAKTMIKAIFDYFSSNKTSKITKVYLMIFMKDTFNSFQTEIKKYGGQPVEKKKGKTRKSLFSSATSDRPRSSNFIVNGINVGILCGDVTESSCDVIVNPTDATITLAGQGVAGAILSKGGDELKELCQVLIANGKKLDSHTLVLETKASGRLQCKHVFHICFEDNDPKSFLKIVNACLQKAEAKSLRSIAFPAIGTGIHRYPDEQAAAGMVNSLQQFSSKPPKYLHNVDIVLFHKSTFEVFVQVFQNPSSSESFLHKAKNFILSPFGFGDSEVIAVPTRDEQLHVAIYGETVEAIEMAEDLFYKFMDEIFITEIIDNFSLDSLSSEDEHRLHQACMSNKVQFAIDRDPVNIIRLKGDASKVREMKCIVVEKLSEILQMESTVREAKQLYEIIKWKRMDSDETVYDELTNYEIEKAYESKTGTYTQGQQNSHIFFTIDFQNMSERDHLLRSKCKVVRVDVLEQLKKGDLPDYWDSMPPDTSLQVVDLQPGSKEYIEVVSKFDQTMKIVPSPSSAAHGSTQVSSSFTAASSSGFGGYNPTPSAMHRKAVMTNLLAAVPSETYSSIIKIQRIQNLVLYGQYMAKKKNMDKNNTPGHANEMLLFHGSSADTCPKINLQGFNRSFSGKNAVAYGNGVYFARDASYSSRSVYSPPDANGYKYMYCARVLTGEYTTGKPGLLVPPPKDRNDYNILFDSVVDNSKSPNIFVTFSDASNYPDYLIVFK